MSRARAVVGLAAVLALAFAVSWTLSPSVRTTLQWSILSRQYKSKVAALPQPADGYLKHTEWDGWGFLGNTDVYLVFDPSNSLASAAAKPEAGRVPGIPCEVYQVRRLENEWYTVWFFTDTSWERCG